MKAAVMEGSRYLVTLNAAFGTVDIDLNRVSVDRIEVPRRTPDSRRLSDAITNDEWHSSSLNGVLNPGFGFRGVRQAYLGISTAASRGAQCAR
jgi:hypothetical protein